MSGEFMIATCCFAEMTPVDPLVEIATCSKPRTT